MIWILRTCFCFCVTSSCDGATAEGFAGRGHDSVVYHLLWLVSEVSALLTMSPVDLANVCSLRLAALSPNIHDKWALASMPRMPWTIWGAQSFVPVFLWWENMTCSKPLNAEMLGSLKISDLSCPLRGGWDCHPGGGAGPGAGDLLQSFIKIPWLYLIT